MNKLFDLSGRVVILTGAAGLLGTQYAEGLSQVGASIVLADKNFSKCKILADSLAKKYDVSPLAIKVDVTSKKSIKNMVKCTIDRFSRIDVLVNNAVFPESKKSRNVSFEKFSLSDWNKVIEVNLTGVFLCCQEIGKIMVRQKSGVIINIGSIYGMKGADQRIYGNSDLNSTAAYAATKSGILNLTRYLASYWHEKGIRVNTLTLGGVDNNQDLNFKKKYSYKTMIGRMARNDEYIGALIFLASDSSSYMTGSNLVVDGGWMAW